MDKCIINLPFGDEVIQTQKDFFTEVSGGEAEGKAVFGLFFNGFYLVHEIGHALSDAMGKKHDNAYASEYNANVTGILYREKAGQNEKLKQCYQYAKKMLLTLKNPVPIGEDYKTDITKHYDELSSDPNS